MSVVFAPDWGLLLWGVLLGYLVYGVVDLLAGIVSYGKPKERNYGIGEIVAGLFYIAWFLAVLLL